jgi:NAD(P)-dependent dehydrogenase (short-subunit alcohol dehydrogenase family)
MLADTPLADRPLGDRPLTGRHLVITGGAGALGAAVVDAMLDAGAVCHLPVRSADSGLRSHENLRVVPGVDLTDEPAVKGFYEACPPLWGSIHLAGGFKAAPLLETSLGDLRQQIDLNLVTAFLCCREAIRNMRRGANGAGAGGAGSGGRLVNVGSRSAIEPTGGSIAYTVGKGAVSVLTRALAAEVLDEGIAVNAILPSTIDTPANRAAMPGGDHGRNYDRWPKPAELAATIAWLISPANTVTSGALIPVYGRA